MGRALGYWLLLSGLTLTSTAEATDWLLLEFARNRPPCEDAQPGDRCWGKLVDIASFEMQAGETLSLPRTGVPLPAWVELRKLWLDAPDEPDTHSPHFMITLDRTPEGARLQMSDGETSYLQALPLNAWTLLAEDRAGMQKKKRKVWARISTELETD